MRAVREVLCRPQYARPDRSAEVVEERQKKVKNGKVLVKFWRVDYRRGPRERAALVGRVTPCAPSGKYRANCGAQIRVGALEI